MQEVKPGFKTGYVAVVGRPNVGKSTLLNCLIGQKVVITSARPQTTRNRILCVYSDPGYQILFFDTPGMHKPKDTLNKYMVEQAKEALQEADLTLILIEFNPGGEPGPGDRYLLELVRSTGIPHKVVLNKIDLGKRGEIEEYGIKCKNWLAGTDLYPTSAEVGTGTEELMLAIKESLKEGPPFYDDSILTDRSERFVVGELIREKIYRLTRQEVPHSTAVLVEEMKDRGKGQKLFIKAVIFVETASQKKILIGNHGEMLKKIGRLAREDVEALLNCAVYMDLWIKIYPHWRRDRQFLEKLERPQYS